MCCLFLVSSGLLSDVVRCLFVSIKMVSILKSVCVMSGYMAWSVELTLYSLGRSQPGCDVGSS